MTAPPVPGGGDPVRAALEAAWAGADPGPTDPARRPAPALALRGPGHPLARFPDRGPGGLLDLALAGDPARRVGGVRLRRVPSAGGRYPVDARLAGPGGVLRYDPLRHALDGPVPPAGGCTLLLGVTAGRTTWRYGARSLPVLLLDLGHAVAAVLAAATALGLDARAVLGHPAASLAEALPDGALPARAVAIGSAAAAVPVPAPGTPARPGGRPVPPAPPTAPEERALGAVLRGGAAGPLRWPPAVPVTAATVLARTSASWERLRRPRAAAVAAAAAVARAAGAEVVVVERDRSPALLAELGRRSCGQPQVGDAAALLLVTGAPEPGPAVLVEHATAALAVHAAWLAATDAGAGARPVGCWIHAGLRVDGRRRRVRHALAIGG